MAGCTVVGGGGWWAGGVEVMGEAGCGCVGVVGGVGETAGSGLKELARERWWDCEFVPVL